MSDGGNLALDWVLNKNMDKILILIPGITGSSKDVYILNMIKEALQSDFTCVVVNHRGSKGTKLTSN